MPEEPTIAHEIDWNTLVGLVKRVENLELLVDVLEKRLQKAVENV